MFVVAQLRVCVCVCLKVALCAFEFVFVCVQVQICAEFKVQIFAATLIATDCGKLLTFSHISLATHILRAIVQSHAIVLRFRIFAIHFCMLKFAFLSRLFVCLLFLFLFSFVFVTFGSSAQIV